jgi:hypothetical protein
VRRRSAATAGEPRVVRFPRSGPPSRYVGEVLAELMGVRTVAVSRLADELRGWNADIRLGSLTWRGLTEAADRVPGVPRRCEACRQQST